MSLAVQKGNLRFVEIAVDEYGVSPNFCDGDGAQLICTAAAGSERMVELLLGLGADPDLADIRGRRMEEYRDRTREFPPGMHRHKKGRIKRRPH